VWLPVMSSIYELCAKECRVHAATFLTGLCCKQYTKIHFQDATSCFRSPLINYDDLNLKHKAVLPISEEGIINHVGPLS
jgi:hypothetical protein